MRPNHGAVPASPRDAAVPPSPQDMAPAPGLSSPAAARALAVLPSSCEGRILPRFPAASPPGSRRTHPGASAQPWPQLLAGTSGGAPPCPLPATAGARAKGAPADFEHTRQFGKPSFPPGAAVGFGDFYFSLFKGKAFCISAPPGPNQLRPRAGWGRGSSGPWWSGDLLQGPWTRGGSGALVRVPK